MRFTLSTDTACDIYRSELKERAIEYIPMHYTIDGVTYCDEFTCDEQIKDFYAKVRAGEMPTTSHIDAEEYEKYFTVLLDRYDGDIVHITISSGITRSQKLAYIVADALGEKTGRRIYVVDSLSASIGARLVVDEAQRLRDNDVDGATAAQALESFAKRVHTWFMPTDLMHLKRGGRVSAPSAYIGTAFNIKPILRIDGNGALVIDQKKIGAGRGIAAMTEIFKATSTPTPHKTYIASADSDLAEVMLKKARAARPDCTFEIGSIGPVIGAHTGCNTVGIAFVSDIARA